MGGGGHFGLWLDEAFEYGSSGACETFGNPPLARDESFRVLKVEFWELMQAAHSPHDSPTHEVELQNRLNAPHALGNAAAYAQENALEQITRQGSSAALVNMLRTDR